MLVLEGVRKGLESFTLEIDELVIESGDYFVVLGLSGAGKTTLLEMIAGFRKPDSGKILLDGEDVTNKPINERKIVMCHGRFLFPHMSVEENIGYGIRDKRRRRERVREVAEMLGIEHLLQRSPETLSMGEQQRVALARALAVEPKVILLDEPLNSLDRLTHESMLMELRRIHEESGITFVHVTHDFIEAISLASRMAILREGRIEQCGSVEEILRRPRNEFVARFVGVKNIFEGSICRENGRYVFEGDLSITLEGEGCFRGFEEGRMKIGIRPEDVLIISNDNCRLGGKNVFEAKVLDVQPITLSTVRVTLEVNGVELVAETIKSKAMRMGLRRGTNVRICVTSAIPITDINRSPERFP